MLMLEIYAGAVDRSFDFQVDESVNTGDAIVTFSNMIAKKCGMKAGSDASGMALYDPSGKKELDKACSLKDNGVVNGTRLILA